MHDHTLTTILTAGRNALARGHRDVAATYARGALHLAPGHKEALALLRDAGGARRFMQGPAYARSFESVR